jgi:hypothetical protein
MQRHARWCIADAVADECAMLVSQDSEHRLLLCDLWLQLIDNLDHAVIQPLGADVLHRLVIQQYCQVSSG